MEYLQQTIYDDLSVSDQIVYNNLDNQGKVYCKLDWLSIIFKDVDIQSVLDYLKIGDCVSDFLKGFYRYDSGMDQRFTFTYNAIRIEVKTQYLWMYPVDDDVFTRVVPEIKLDLSGSALDWLRAHGLNVDEYFRFNPFSPDPESYHFTRSDFAFDFINYAPSFMDELVNFCLNYHTDSGRIIVYKKSGSYVYSLKLGREKTVYLGSPKSDKVLRCYDKRLESSDPDTGVYFKTNPYGNPDSWFRLELQLRNYYANGTMKDLKTSFETVLKQIFENYAFADPGRHHLDRRPVEFWEKLLPWNDLKHRIIQNAKYVQCKSPEEQTLERGEKRLLDFSIYYTLLVQLNQSIDDNIKAAKKNLLPGQLKDIEVKINIQLKNLFRDPELIRKRQAFINKINQIKSITIPDKSLLLSGLYLDGSEFGFRF